MEVPAGKVTTYKELAKAMKIKSSQAVGQAMKRNPYAPRVPCHRVVSANGSIGGFCGKTSGKPIKDKIALLENEGVEVRDGKIMNFEKRLKK